MATVSATRSSFSCASAHRCTLMVRTNTPCTLSPEWENDRPVRPADLRRVDNDLGRTLADLNLRADPLNLRGLLFELRRQSFRSFLLLGDDFLLFRNPGVQPCDAHLLLLKFTMLLEELVEQHRVHRFVAHGINLAIGIARDQIGIYLFYFLGYQPKLRDTSRVKLFLVAKRDRFEREDNFTGLIHRLDLVFEPLRGDDGAEMTVGIDDYPYASSDGRPTNAGDKRMRLSSFCANADVIGLASFTLVANIDVVTAGREIDPRI